MVIEGGIPMFGRLVLRVEEVIPVSIHGDVYFDLTVRIMPTEEDEVTDTPDNKCPIRQPSYRVRVPNHLCAGRTPAIGDILEITFLAQQASELVYLS